MPCPNYRYCRNCDGHVSKVGSLSWTRLCVKCSDELLTENVLGLASMSNPARDRWRRGMAASVGAVLLDERQPAA